MTTKSQEFVKKATAKHGKTYDYTKSCYIDARTKVEIICIKHGSFWQLPRKHIKGSKCPACARASANDYRKVSKEEFVRRATSIHGNKYDYSQIELNSLNDKVLIKCLKHGTFKQRAMSHLKGHGCIKCKRNSKPPKPTLKVASTQSPNTDGLCLTSGIVIDYYVMTEHSYNRPETRAERMRHHNKATAASEKGIKLIQVYESEWLNKQDIVKSILLHSIGRSPNRIYARQTTIVDLTDKEASEFYNRSHIQGHRSSRYHYALIKGDLIYACMSFSKSSQFDYELMRFACAPYTAVVGGASKLFKHFTNKYKPSSILSYADRRYSTGNLYRRLGFDLAGITRPNYMYVNGLGTFSRQKYQKNKLGNALSVFDPLLSEPQNMFRNGFRRIWDAGHYKFIWRSKDGIQ